CVRNCAFPPAGFCPSSCRSGILVECERRQSLLLSPQPASSRLARFGGSSNPLSRLPHAKPCSPLLAAETNPRTHAARPSFACLPITSRAARLRTRFDRYLATATGLLRPVSLNSEARQARGIRC